MIYRMRTYFGIRDPIAHTEFFQEHLLPVQLRYGARLVGRWKTDDRIVALWEYDDLQSYHDIQSLVRADPDSIHAQSVREQQSGELFYESSEEIFMTSTFEDLGV